MPDFEFIEEIRESSREVLETGEKVSNAEKSLEVAQKTGIEEQIKAAEKGVAEARQEHIESSNKFAESLAKDSTGKVDPQRATELKGFNPFRNIKQVEEYLTNLGYKEAPYEAHSEDIT